MTISFSSFLVLIIALSLDIFTAALSYGSSRVRVPFPSLLTIALLSGLILTLSFQAGSLLAPFLPSSLLRLLSFLVLMALALYKLYDVLPRRKREKAPRSFSTDDLSRRVNRGDVRVLSLAEAALLALALSVDNISAGLGCGGCPLPAAATLLLTCAIHLLSVSLGLLAGRFLCRNLSFPTGWLSAALLFLLALCRLF